MAYLRELDRDCSVPGCKATAVVEIFSETHESVGRYCRKDGQQRLKHGSEAERTTSVQKPTFAGMNTEAFKR